MPMTAGNAGWFMDSFGFQEDTKSFSAVRGKMELTTVPEELTPWCPDAVVLKSTANGRSFHVGPFQVAPVALHRHCTFHFARPVHCLSSLF